MSADSAGGDKPRPWCAEHFKVMQSQGLFPPQNHYSAEETLIYCKISALEKLRKD